MRTKEQIITKIPEILKHDLFGWNLPDYLEFLSFEEVRSLGVLKENVDCSDWPEPRPLTEEEVRRRMSEYMPFAWGKANNCRGISASRSIDHFRNWLWLLGEDELAAEIEDYEYYGKPQLRKVCNFLGLDADQWDDGERVNRG